MKQQTKPIRKVIYPRTSLLETFKSLYDQDLLKDVSENLEDTSSQLNSSIPSQASQESTKSENERDIAVNLLTKKLAPFFEKLYLDLQDTSNREKDRYSNFQRIPTDLNPLKDLFRFTPFGSGMFGGFDKHSDIDVLLSSFKFLLSREDFFSKFSAYLKSPEVGAIIHQEIPQAQIPIIKFEFMSKQFDVLYCSMLTPISQHQRCQLEKDQYFFEFSNVVQEKVDVFSFRGWSNCQYMYERIKDKEAFGWGLKIIKAWAKKKGLYGFNFGYLNGISLIIMLGKVDKMIRRERFQSDYCDDTLSRNVNNQLSFTIPNRTLKSNNKIEDRVCELVTKFFEVYSKWDSKQPIFFQDNNSWSMDQDLYSVCLKEVFPIVTPERPYKCTTHQINTSSLNHIMEQLQTAQNLCILIQKRQLILDLVKYQNDNAFDKFGNPKKDNYNLSILKEFGQVTWKDLFNPYQFFTQHTIFLQIEVMTDVNISQYNYDNVPDDPIGQYEVVLKHHHEYKGLFESRFKLLQLMMEQSLEIENIQIFTDVIDRDFTQKSKLIDYRGSKFISSLYYFGLPYKELTVELKNQITGVLCKLIISNIQNSPLTHVEQHTAHFRFLKFSHLPPETLQYCLENYIEGYSEMPCYAVEQQMSSGDIWEKIQEDPNYFGEGMQIYEAKD
eukprot:403334159